MIRFRGLARLHRNLATRMKCKCGAPQAARYGKASSIGGSANVAASVDGPCPRTKQCVTRPANGALARRPNQLHRRTMYRRTAFRRTTHRQATADWFLSLLVHRQHRPPPRIVVRNLVRSRRDPAKRIPLREWCLSIQRSLCARSILRRPCWN
jgi:hypothetical protein